MLNGIAVMSDEANAECDAYLKHPRFIVDPGGNPMMGLDSKLCVVTLHNLTRD